MEQARPEDELYFRTTVEVELLKLGVPWSVLERANDERILMYWAIVTEQAKLEEDEAADRADTQRAQALARGR